MIIAGLQRSTLIDYPEKLACIVYLAGCNFRCPWCYSSELVLPLKIAKQPRLSEKDFFDFEAKYQGKSEEITPAVIDHSMSEQLKTAAKKVYQLLNCRGVVRIDFIYSETLCQPFMLEVNTVPGQSTASVIPQQVKAMGWTLTDFYSALIEEALNRS